MPRARAGTACRACTARDGGDAAPALGSEVRTVDEGSGAAGATGPEHERVDKLLGGAGTVWGERGEAEEAVAAAGAIDVALRLAKVRGARGIGGARRNMAGLVGVARATRRGIDGMTDQAGAKSPEGRDA